MLPSRPLFTKLIVRGKSKNNHAIVGFSASHQIAAFSSYNVMQNEHKAYRPPAVNTYKSGQPRSNTAQKLFTPKKAGTGSTHSVSNASCVDPAAEEQSFDHPTAESLYVPGVEPLAMPSPISITNTTDTPYVSLKGISDNDVSDVDGIIQAFDIRKTYAAYTTKYNGIGSSPVTEQQYEILKRKLPIGDIEITPDGMLYLPEIKYRRILCETFRPGGWGLAPQGPASYINNFISQEWGLYVNGKLVAIARGENRVQAHQGIPRAIESAKSNAVMRCCKDLGIASELWDPCFIQQFKAEHCVRELVTKNNKRQYLWRLKSRSR